MSNGIRLDFSKEEIGGILSGLFTETGILGMLKAKVYENIDLVSPFFREIADVRCGNSKCAPIADVFTRYTDLIQTIRKQNDRPGWIEHELLDLQRQIDLFENRAKTVFGLYQPSCMRTSK